MRDLLILAIGLLPASRLKNWSLRRLGHAVSATAVVKPCLFLRVGHITLEPGSSIGFGNTFRALRELRLAENAEMGQFNYLTGGASHLTARSASQLAGCLTLDRESAIASRHYLDASGGIVVGAFTIVSGVHSILMTHGVDLEPGIAVTAPITLGRYCLVGSAARIMMNSVVPDGSVIAMGSVVRPGLTEPNTLYAGMPATARGPVSGAYMSRKYGRLSRNEVRGLDDDAG